MSTPVPANPLPTFGTGSLLKGTVKQILSGDTIIVRGIPKGGPPPERTVGLSGVTAPRLARRPTDFNSEFAENKDEPLAWETREFLRKKLIGKEVCFVLDPKTLGNKKEFGLVYLGKDTSGENIVETLVNEGLVEVRKAGIRIDEQHTKLLQLEEVAVGAKKGKWGDDASTHVRDVRWSLENPRQFVDSCKNNEIDAVIEHVRDGCTIRAFLLPSFQYVTLMFTGIKTPMFKIEDGKSVPEPFAEEVKYFTEVRLLQRDVKVIVEGASNQNLLATVKHPSGNISELLLSEGFAHCTDWSMKNVTQGVDKMRTAEKRAKEKKLRLWKDYVAPPPAIEIKEKKLAGKVVEVVNGDALIVRLTNDTVQKVFISSIRPPRPQDTGADPEKKSEPRVRPRPLYDTPYMFDAREFLRKKLIGKKVNIEVDYIQPKSADFPEKMCCSVFFAAMNMGEALVNKGLATVVRYRQSDDQRSSYYDDLLRAEDKAKNKGVGVHSKKEPSVVRVADLAGDLQKAKHFLSFLLRAGVCEALVEFVASGSRLRLYIPKETCLITFLLAGIECPRGSRPTQANLNGPQMTPAEPFGEEAFNFIKELILQREVTVEVEGMDKGGNFIGWCFIEGLNLSIALVEEGLAKMHFTAERSNHFKALQDVEAKARAKKLNIWSLEPETKVDPEEVVVPTERKVNYKKVVVSEVTPELNFYAQNVESGPSLEDLMARLRTEFQQAPPLPASYTPKKGDLCAAKFVDGQWYRALVEKVFTTHKASVLYVDFGNRETLEMVRLATLPSSFHQLSPQAQLYTLACVALPKDPDDILTTVRAFSDEVNGRQFLLNVEYKTLGVEHASLLDAENKEVDVAQVIIRDGLLLGERRRERHLKELVDKYRRAEEAAKNERLNLWKYGDFTGDDV